MNERAANLLRMAALAAALSLAACGESGPELADIDNQIVGNERDPALTSALEDQILVDPALTQQSNRNAVRPPETPTQAQYPASEAAAEAAGAECAPAISRGAGWADKLPKPFAIYPSARLAEAAGSDRPGCRVRIVTFAAAAPPERVIEHYRTRAAEAGWSAERKMRAGDHVLAGTKGSGAFYLILTPRPDATSEVALIVSEG